MAASTKVQHRKKETAPVTPPINFKAWDEQDWGMETKVRHHRYSISLPGVYVRVHAVQCERNLKVIVKDHSQAFMMPKHPGHVAETFAFQPFTGEINITLDENHVVVTTETKYINGILQITTKYDDPKKMVHYDIPVK